MPFRRINLFNRAEHYHDWCEINNWNNQWEVENCPLCGLPDLNQDNNWVTQKLLEWIHDLVQKYNLDGFIIDTIMEVPKWFWDKFRASAGVFQIGEAFNGDPGYVTDYKNNLDSVFNYPLYYTIKSSFCDSFRNLEGYREPLWDNYNTKSTLYQLLGKAHALRKKVQIWNYGIVQRYADDNFYAFIRGNVLACFTNVQSSQYKITYHDFKEGDKLWNALYDRDCVTVSGGAININMGDYQKLYVKQ